MFEGEHLFYIINEFFYLKINFKTSNFKLKF